jgi:hypothetical protein
MPTVRTTIDLEDALAEKLKSLALKRKTSLRQIVHEVLQRGLGHQKSSETRKAFRVDPFHSPFQAGVDPLKLNQLVDELEVHRSGKSK